MVIWRVRFPPHQLPLLQWLTLKLYDFSLYGRLAHSSRMDARHLRIGVTINIPGISRT
jgi:hypothetical protein